ncbi:DMT family transporter [Marinomonas sp. C2222]|uniref:DMT family transporter n=1 Tax=Marinomonas sargassi TaxID=2984494 RepID=A0ABT2YQI2_9GAMM|nr:DMT family transporter [Marinomonas sargassi]MCV2402147.1 DMT family transporter [Marinomonas sargassi]
MTVSLRVITLVFLSLLAFAANSVLCRLALDGGLIDPANFTLLRLVSGAVTLALLCMLQKTPQTQPKILQVWYEGNWISALALFVYAIGFSYAYVTLETGIGALILFGSVQLTMILFAVLMGQKLGRQELLGLVIAFIGFVYLVLPTLSSPSLFGFILMTFSGIAWGIYTWRGKVSSSPLFATASNFIRTLPVLAVSLIVIHFFQPYSLGNVQYEGVILALVSGAIMSGIGYALWYAVLPSLATSLAAVLQLLVPIIATIGGVVFAGENVTLHLLIATAGVLGGVLLVIFARSKKV